MDKDKRFHDGLHHCVLCCSVAFVVHFAFCFLLLPQASVYSSHLAVLCLVVPCLTRLCALLLHLPSVCVCLRLPPVLATLHCQIAVLTLPSSLTVVICQSFPLPAS